jgi:hypothetical protein
MSRKIGDPLENYVDGTFPLAFKTKNSGGLHGDGDLLTPDFLIECKTKSSCLGISFSGREVLKGKQQAVKKTRQPLFVLKNGDAEMWAAMPYAKLVRIMKELQELREQVSGA